MTSFISYLKNGLSATDPLNRFCVDKDGKEVYQKNAIKILDDQPSNQFKGVVEFAKQQNSEEIDPHHRIIDKVIHVYSVTDTERMWTDNKGNIIENQYGKQVSKADFWLDRFYTTGSIAIGGVTITIGVYLFKITIGVLSPWIATTISIAGLAITFFAGYRAYFAYVYSDQWNDPVQKVMEERIKVGLEGFTYAYKKFLLKDQIIHQKEAETLWIDWEKKYFTDMISFFSIKGFDAINKEDKLKKIDDFFNLNPYGEKEIVCAFGSSDIGEKRDAFKQKFINEFFKHYLSSSEGAAEAQKKITQDSSSSLKDGKILKTTLLNCLSTLINEKISNVTDQSESSNYQNIHTELKNDINQQFTAHLDKVNTWIQKRTNSRVSKDRLLEYIDPIIKFSQAISKNETTGLNQLALPELYNEDCPTFEYNPDLLSKKCELKNWDDVTKGFSTMLKDKKIIE